MAKRCRYICAESVLYKTQNVALQQPNVSQLLIVMKVLHASHSVGSRIGRAQPRSAGQNSYVNGKESHM